MREKNIYLFIVWHLLSTHHYVRHFHKYYLTLGTNPQNLVAFPPHSCTCAHTSPQAKPLLVNLRQGSGVPCRPVLSLRSGFCSSSSQSLVIYYRLLSCIFARSPFFWIFSMNTETWSNNYPLKKKTYLRVAAGAYGVSFCEENVLKLDCGDAYKTWWIY